MLWGTLSVLNAFTSFSIGDKFVTKKIFVLLLGKKIIRFYVSALPVVDMLNVLCLTPFTALSMDASFCTSVGLPFTAIISRQLW